MKAASLPYITHLESKNEYLEKMLEIKNKEIELYREILKDIGCEIKERFDTRTISRPDRLHGDEDVPVMITGIYYEKQFMSRVDYKRQLDLIEEVLKLY